MYLALQMLSGTGLDIRPEMRQPLRPGTGDAERVETLHRLGHRLGRRPERWLGGRNGPETRCRRHVLGAVFQPGLDPPAAHHRAGPRGHQADAVSCRHDGVQIRQQGRPRQSLEGILAYREGRFEIERHPRDDAERTERHNRSVESGIAAMDRHYIAGRANDVERGDRGREIAEPVARAVGAGRDRAGDRDVRQRGHVMQRPTHPLQVGGQHTVVCRAPDRDATALRVDQNVWIDAA
jgi:hypothetical protein